MTTQLAVGKMLKGVCVSLLYWTSDFLTRKSYDGLADDKWSLGIVLYVMITDHFPYIETTPDGMHTITTTTVCPIPYHLTKTLSHYHCTITHGPDLVQGTRVPVGTGYRVPVGQLLGRPWTCHIQERVPYATKETIPSVIQSIHTIGNNCEEIVSFITQRKLTETINILK